MTADTYRSITFERLDEGVYRATNKAGATLTFGNGADAFSPVELFLAAIGGCTAIDVDGVTSRRAEPEQFEVLVDGHKVRDESGNIMTDLAVTFRVTFPAGEAGDAARDALPRALAASHDRTCTVSRTIERGTPVAARLDQP